MIAVAKITRSVGLKGLIQVESLSGDTDRLHELRQVFVGDAVDTARPAMVESAESRGTKVVLKLRSVDDRTGADALNGKWIFVAEEEGVKAHTGSYFVHDVIGLQAVREDGTPIGVVTDVVDLPAGDAWVVRIGVRDVMIPAVREFIRDVDLQARRVVIRPIEGLLE